MPGQRITVGKESALIFLSLSFDWYEASPSKLLFSSESNWPGEGLIKKRNFLRIRMLNFPGGIGIRICQPTQETRVPSLAWEDSTCCGAAESVRHSYSARALQPETSLQ